MKNRRTVARLAVLVLITVGFAGIQGSGEPAQAASSETRSWTYWHIEGQNITTTLTYSPTDTPYDAVVRACRAAGQPAPARGTDLEKMVASHPNFWTEQAKGGYAADAFMSLVGDKQAAINACAGGGIIWR